MKRFFSFDMFIATSSFFLVCSSSLLAATPKLGVSEVFCTCEDPAASTSKVTTVTPKASTEAQVADSQTMLVESNNVPDANMFPWNMFMPAIALTHGKECTGWITDEDKWIYSFGNTIRIGDDLDFNENHPGQTFCSSSAYSHTYSAEFTLPSECEYSTATMQYYATGVYGDNRIYINGKLVDTTCKTGNIAGLGYCCTNGEIDIKDALRAGTNTLYIETVLFPGDDYTPYDDIELYRLHITLTQK